MKKYCILLFVGFLFQLVNAKEDPAIMTIAGKKIPLSEFLYIASKDSTVDLRNPNSLEKYLNLFKNFKLKVADAEAVGIDKEASFQKEYSTYLAQLKSDMLSDRDWEEQVLRNEYNRHKEQYTVSTILFHEPSTTVTKDTVQSYKEALEVYQQIQNGADFGSVGEKLAEENKDRVIYNSSAVLHPLQTMKIFEDVVYQMQEGEMSLPIRTNVGYVLIKILERIPNPGLLRVAHILTPDSLGLEHAEMVQKKAVEGEDFAELAATYSIDSGNKDKGGILPDFGKGEMVDEFEKAAYALQKPGEISTPIKTRYGYHIVQLIEKKEIPPYETLRRFMYEKMRQGEWNFLLYAGFDKRMKEKYQYHLYEDAYKELQELADSHFPTDSLFTDTALKLEKPLIRLNGNDHLQKEFGAYIYKNPFSTKSYSNEFMQEVFDLFVRDIYRITEEKELQSNEEFKLLSSEYYDGILLFEISNLRVWSKPAEEQEKAEQEWLQSLDSKHEVKINKKLLKNIKKYL